MIVLAQVRTTRKHTRFCKAEYEISREKAAVVLNCRWSGGSPWQWTLPTKALSEHNDAKC